MLAEHLVDRARLGGVVGRRRGAVRVDVVDVFGVQSGVNIAGAIRLARELGPGHVVVTVLADGGTRYAKKLFNPEFLRSKGLPVPAWLDRAFPTEAARNAV